MNAVNQVLLFFLTLDYGEYVISLLIFIKTKVNSVYEILPLLPWNNLNRLSIGFSYLKNKFGHDINKFGHDIEDCFEPICNSGNGPKTTSQFFPHCASLDVQRETLFNKITSIDGVILAENKNRTVYIVIGKTKVQISLTKCNMGNGHCFSKREI